MSKTSKSNPIEVVIDYKTGSLLISRDDEIALDIVKDLCPDDYEKFLDFFESKPKPIDGKVFCG